MRQLMMIHLLDTIPDVPAAPGYSIRAFRPGDEEAWVEICRCGLCAEDATISAWNDAIVGRAELKPESDGVFATNGRIDGKRTRSWSRTCSSTSHAVSGRIVASSVFRPN